MTTCPTCGRIVTGTPYRGAYCCKEHYDMKEPSRASRALGRIIDAVVPRTKAPWTESKLCNFCNEELTQEPYTKYAIVRCMYFQDMNICVNCWHKEEAMKYIRKAVKIYYPSGRFIEEQEEPNR